MLPSAIRSRASTRILSITVKVDGAVEVSTYSEGRIHGEVMFTYGSQYHLKKGRDGWQIVDRADWIS
jgi:hypothetical protein